MRPETRLCGGILLAGVFLLTDAVAAQGGRKCELRWPCYICSSFLRVNPNNCAKFQMCFRNGVKRVQCIDRRPRIDNGPRCGVRAARNIVGGVESVEGEWPWQVSLRDFDKHFCGGVLIDRLWILTAAHCVYWSVPSKLSVVLGEHRLDFTSRHEQRRKLANIFVHPDFHYGGNYPNDIALLKLTYPVRYTLYVQPACLPSPSDRYAYDSSCWITGWGDTKGTGDANVLRKLRAHIINHKRCAWNWENVIEDSHICVNNGETGACVGDSGGPLSCVRMRDDRFAVVGVTSWGDLSCTARGHSSIYTNVTTHLDWVTATMDLNSK